MSSIYALLSLCYIGFAVLVLTPLLLYRFTIFHKVKHHPILHARRPLLLLISVTICVLCNLIIVPLFLYCEIISGTFLNISLSWAILNAAYTALILSFGIRFWQNLYDLKYNSSIANSIWQQAINQELNPSMWIKYRHSLGSPKFYVSMLFIATLLCFVASLCFSILLPSNKKDEIQHLKISLLVVTFVDIIIVILLLFGLNLLIKQSDDNIGFKKETKPAQAFVFIALLLTITAASWLISVDSKYIEYDMVTFQWTVINSFGLTIGCIMQCYVPVAIYLKNVSVQMTNKKTSSLQNTMKLSDVLCDIDGLKLFAQHCVKEYNVENILFIIEINQFKKLIKDSLSADQDIAINVLNLPIHLLPTSSMMSKYVAMQTNDNLDSVTMITQCFIALYRKYIDWSTASWEINISSYARNVMHISLGLCKDYRLNSNGDSSKDVLKSVIKTIDVSQQNVLDNLEDAFARFRKTEAFAQCRVND